MDLNDIERRLTNLIRVGVVAEVKGYYARVTVGGNITDWIRWGVARAGDAVVWWPPSVGEQVCLFSPGGDSERAFILASHYSDAIPPPDNRPRAYVVQFPDGARVEYDPDASAARLSGTKTVTVQATTSVTLDTPDVICTNHLKTGTLTVEKGGKMTGNITHSGGAFSSNGVIAHTHTHTGVERGGSSTDGPR